MKIIGKKLAFITAHPDDESFIASGTIRKNIEAKGQSFVLCATLGEKGSSHLKKKVSAAALKRIRKAELEAVSKYLRVTKLHTFNFPDTGLKGREKEVYAKLLPVTAKIAPDFIISFGPDGMSGHLDHVAIGKVAKQIAKKLGKPFLAFARSAQFQKRAKSFLKQRRRNGKYLKDSKYNYIKPDIKILIDGRVKLKALAFHKSQMSGRPFSKTPGAVAAEMLKAEYYVSHS